MAGKVAWSSEALADVERVAEHIAKDSPTYAASLVERFFSATDELGTFPGMGRAIPELEQPEYRDWIVGPCRITYRLDADRGRLLVIAVVHGARQLGNAIGDRLPKPRRARRQPPDGGARS